MKNIELTEDHKSKLLEMCKELFPEYKVINFTKFNDYSDNTGEGGKINIDNILVFFKDKNAWNEKYQYFNEEFTPNLCIHWFEFCMTHLTKKVLKNNYFRLTAFSNGVLFRNRQPIDILYYEFKKLK